MTKVAETVYLGATSCAVWDVII